MQLQINQALVGKFGTDDRTDGVFLAIAVCGILFFASISKGIYRVHTGRYARS